MTDRISTTPRQRRLLVAIAAGSIAIAATAALAAQPAALAAPPAVQPLPKAGTEATLNLTATDVPIQVGEQVVKATFTGTTKLRAENTVNGPYGQSVAVRVVSFDMQANTTEFGKITLAQKAAPTSTPAAQGALQIIRPYPLALRHTLALDLTVTVERLPLTTGTQQAATLQSKAPVVLVSDDLTAFPPQSVTYKLQQPVELVSSTEPATTVATIQQLPVRATVA